MIQLGYETNDDTLEVYLVSDRNGYPNASSTASVLEMQLRQSLSDMGFTRDPRTRFDHKKTKSGKPQL
ncbi:MAG: hypothetical protein ACI8Y7_000668 [Candidatus Woesearchaeota archaeon]|jgi:hypothetical protein